MDSVIRQRLPASSAPSSRGGCLRRPSAVRRGGCWCPSCACSPASASPPARHDCARHRLRSPVTANLADLVRAAEAEVKDADRTLPRRCSRRFPAATRAGRGRRTRRLPPPRPRPRPLLAPGGLTAVTRTRHRGRSSTTRRRFRPASTSTPTSWLSTSRDLQAVVNALWAGGAEAMTIAGQRVIATSAVRCVGNTLLLNGDVYSPPFRVAAIGPYSRMRKPSMSSPGVTLFKQAAGYYGLGYTVESQDAPRSAGVLAGPSGCTYARAVGQKMTDERRETDDAVGESATTTANRLPSRSEPTAGRPRSASVLRGVGQTLITAGLVDLAVRRLRGLGHQCVRAPRADQGAQRAGEEVGQRQGPAAAAGRERSSRIPIGTGIANLYIPRLGQRLRASPSCRAPTTRRWRKGPGHYTGTALPGQVGNFAVAGHRVGKGEPFLNLDQLQPGDAVIVETRTDWYVYRVKATRQGEPGCHRAPTACPAARSSTRATAMCCCRCRTTRARNADGDG